MAPALRLAALPLLLSPCASALRIPAPKQEQVFIKQEQVFIPDTTIPMPSDYEDYARGRTPWRLFGPNPPGQRVQMKPPGPGLPGFEQLNRTLEPELFVDATPKDFLGHWCAPGGDAAGHYFYRVWDPELVPFIVDRRHPDFKNASVVVAPGGGNIHLAWEGEGIAQAEWLNSLGISAFILKYRVPHKSAELGLMDGQRAVALVRARAAEHGLDPARVGILGFSAGGSVALEVSTRAELAYPPQDATDSLPTLPDFTMLLYPAAEEGAYAGSRLKNLPPTFMSYTFDDNCCPISKTWTLGQLAKLNSRRPVEIVEYKKGKHGWGACDYYPALKGMPMCGWHSEAEKFLRKHVLGL